MNKIKIAALIPMRHSSERVPGKNYRSFAGKPLFFHIVENLLKSKFVDEIIIDTDSPNIIKMTRDNFPTVLILERPEHLRDGSIAMNDVLLNITNQIEADLYLQTHSTNPLLKSNTIDTGLKKLLESFPMYDSLFTVTKRNVRFWDILARPINHNQDILLRTQDLPPIFEENSCMYIFSKDILKSKHNRIGNRPMLFEIDPIESQDIDVELDFKVAEFLFKEVNNLK
uniref:acylneuraminate cytidylyltransferase family protein n=1 Tax=Flavobacterium sp. TaxID=239 RepID=UPI004049DF0D